MPAGARREAADREDGSIEQRLTTLEEVVAALGGEVRTRRLLITAGEGDPRIVGEVAHGTAELRLEVPVAGDARRPAVVLHASRAPTGPCGDDTGLGPAVGLQLWADGDAVVALDARPDMAARWLGQLHVEGDGGRRSPDTGAASGGT